MVHIVKTGLSGAVGVALAAALMALMVPAHAAAAKTADQLWQEVETFQYLHALSLTGVQAGQAADALEPVCKLAASLQERAESPEVLAALGELRAAALAGQPITEEMYKKVTTAKAKASAEWTDQASPTLWAAAAEAAGKIAAGLSHDQLLAAARSAANDQADTVVTGAAGQADADAESWAQWSTDTVSEIAATNALAEGAEDKIAGLLAKVHGLSAEAAEAQKTELRDQLVSLMVAPASDEDLSKLAVDALTAQIVDNHELQSCLREYATAAGK
jgi:hypothetical protein